MSGKENKKKEREEKREKSRNGEGGKGNEKTRKKEVTQVSGERQSREAYDGSQNGRNRSVYPSNVKAINVSLAATTTIASDGAGHVGAVAGCFFFSFSLWLSRVNGSVSLPNKRPISISLDRDTQRTEEL